MSDLQWIRFANGKEKQVPKHIALDPTVQKAQKFEAIDKPGGNVVASSVLPETSKKKDVAVAAAVKPDEITEKPALTDKDLFEQHKGGKPLKEIASGLGIHWKSVEKRINDYKAANPEPATTLTNETPNT